MASRITPIAFPIDYIHCLPSIHDLVKNIQTPTKTEDSGLAPEDQDDFILIEAEDESPPPSPVADISALSINPPTTQDTTTPSSPFVDMLIETSRQTNLLTRTDNGALTHPSSTNPLVDLFYTVKEATSPALLRKHLHAAWSLSPLKALKLVFLLRDIRNGKGCRDEFYVAAQLILDMHPETFKANVVRFAARFGYWKDLLEVLVRDLLGEEGVELERIEGLQNQSIFAPGERAKRKLQRNKRPDRSRSRGRGVAENGVDGSAEGDDKGVSAWQAKKLRSQARRSEYAQMTSEDAIKATAAFAMDIAERQNQRKQQIRSDRVIKRNSGILQCQAQWMESRKWRDLHVAIAKQFAVGLYRDKTRLDRNQKVSSLCAKWAPTPGHYHDKRTCIATTIALILFPVSIHRKENELDEEYIARALRMYQGKYLSPLREAAHIVERLLSKRQYEDINYSHVPSISFKRNKTTFDNHDHERFSTHVRDAAAGKEGKTVHASTLKPHEIVGQLLRSGNQWDGWNTDDDDQLDHERPATTDLDAQIIEAQWLNYVETIKKSGSLDNCIAIADVSGSMYSRSWPSSTPDKTTPIEVCIALSLLVAAVSQPPFDQTLMTFSAHPELIHLPPSATSLAKKVDLVKSIQWGMNTDFQAVFDLILHKAIATNLPKQHMIKTIFVFSDMQFDQAASAPFETDYQQIVRKFAQKGYDVPKMVFWNLNARGGRENDTPVLCDTIGTAMVSGWSGQMLKLFMESGGEMINSPEFSPEFLMEKAIGKPVYDVLKIVD